MRAGKTRSVPNAAEGTTPTRQGYHPDDLMGHFVGRFLKSWISYFEDNSILLLNLLLFSNFFIARISLSFVWGLTTTFSISKLTSTGMNTPSSNWSKSNSLLVEICSQFCMNANRNSLSLKNDLSL